ncbi:MULTISPECIES: hypothetical protein [Pseudoalteromonas]|uniref:Serine/threonine protein kinase n=1 Tax=Pseudoalteromonas amylolytica TaxID=1859457 RepID=A0A1S1MZT7_9GAMM|nr:MULTISPECIES: hypothetical protein [Pseudoalteromonas]OHU85476.1 hypothetical protein BFC16_19185 [Pseudoalteromonas sp. JW3]OHU92903.1 hypothetical protein BET10_02530 [Pseudoalteromonas amylolytica]
MKLSGLFKVSLVASALVLAGCGGDIKVTPTVNDNSVNNSNNTTNNSGNPTDPTDPTPDPGGKDNPCTKRTVAGNEVQGEFVAPHCVYGTDFAGKTLEIEDDITFAALENGGAHVFDGAIQMGKDCNTTQNCTIDTNGPTLNVEAGATLAFRSGEAIIRIGRGAKINAVGTADAPITFTSANVFSEFDIAETGPQFADWGGIIINGFGLTNQCTNAERAANTCNATSEGITSHFGGKNNADSSGTIKFANIWYAGSGPREGGDGDDLNSLTLNAVGSGSTFDYLHIHQGFDDGIEFFGGAANIKHIVVTDTQDDSIDIDAGWQGNAQFIYVQHGTVKTKKDVTYTNDDDELVTIPAGSEGFMGNNGFETDGEKNGGEEYSEAPASNPTIANVTVVTTDGKSIRDNGASQAVKFDDAIQGQYYNALLVKAVADNNTACVEFKDDAEEAAKNDTLNFNNSVLACVNHYKNGEQFKSGGSKSEWFVNNASSQILNSAEGVLAADGFSTNTASTEITIQANNLSGLDLSFFDQVDYIGAVSDKDTTSDWYKWVQKAIAATKNQ